MIFVIILIHKNQSPLKTHIRVYHHTFVIYQYMHVSVNIEKMFFGFTTSLLLQKRSLLQFLSQRYRFNFPFPLFNFFTCQGSDHLTSYTFYELAQFKNFYQSVVIKIEIDICNFTCTCMQSVRFSDSQPQSTFYHKNAICPSNLINEMK